jgi:hypothetical protein
MQPKCDLGLRASAASIEFGRSVNEIRVRGSSTERLRLNFKDARKGHPSSAKWTYYALSGKNNVDFRRAARAGDCRSLPPMDSIRIDFHSPWSTTTPGRRTARFSHLATHHALRQFSVFDAPHSQRPPDPHGPSAALLESALHSRNRVVAVDPDCGADRPHVNGQG